MFKQLMTKGLIFTLTMVMILAFALQAGAAEDALWKQLYFSNIRAAADYVATWDESKGFISNNVPALFGTGILDIAIADLNFDGIPELMYAESIPAGAGNNYVHILSIANGSVVKLAAYELMYANKNYFPTLSANAAGERGKKSDRHADKYHVHAQ